MGDIKGPVKVEEAPPPFEAASSSVPAAGPSSQAVFRTRFACITLNMTDRIRFINFPPSDVEILRDHVQRAWQKGIQDFRTYGQAKEIKLNGNPWRSDFSGSDGARRLVRKLLEALYDMGWVLQAAIDLSKKESDKDSLIFRYQSPPPPPCEWLSISFDRSDRLRISDPPSSDLAATVVSAFGQTVSKDERKPGYFEIKFHGYPWYPSGEETVKTRMMVVRLLEVLESFGYTLYASIDQTNGPEGEESDVLVVHKQKNWVPGMPIWHR